MSGIEVKSVVQRGDESPNVVLTALAPEEVEVVGQLEGALARQEDNTVGFLIPREEGELVDLVVLNHSGGDRDGTVGERFNIHHRVIDISTLSGLETLVSDIVADREQSMYTPHPDSELGQHMRMTHGRVVSAHIYRASMMLTKNGGGWKVSTVRDISSRLAFLEETRDLIMSHTETISVSNQ